MKFIYTGDDEREFPSLPATLKPGDVVEADDNPDPSRFSKGKSASRSPSPSGEVGSSSE